MRIKVDGTSVLELANGEYVVLTAAEHEAPIHSSRIDGMRVAGNIARGCVSGFGAAHYINAEWQRLAYEGP